MALMTTNAAGEIEYLPAPTKGATEPMTAVVYDTLKNALVTARRVCHSSLMDAVAHSNKEEYLRLEGELGKIDAALEWLGASVEVIEIIRRWRGIMAKRADTYRDGPADFIGRMLDDEVAKIDAWLGTPTP